jgi:hypothetical protein
LHCFFFAFFFSISPLDICLIKNLTSLFFFCLLLLRSPHSHDPGNRFGGLVRVDFRLFLKHFFCQCFFFSFYLFIGSSQFLVKGYVSDLWTRVGCRVRSMFFFIIFFFCFYKFFKFIFLNYLLINFMVRLGFKVSWVMSFLRFDQV